MMPAIKLTNISKTFKMPQEKKDSIREYFIQFSFKLNYYLFKALDQINLQVNRGEWLGLIGPNGSGKSTLLNIIANIYEPDSGEIKINGRLVPLLELGVGFNPELSARDNIFLNGTILGMSRKQITGKFNSIVNFSGIKDFLDLKLKNFSTGMQVRLAFAVAMQAQGDIYLLDEVLAVGDHQFRQKTKKVFEIMKKNKKTVILVSHELKQIAEICDRVVWLDKGKIRKIGKPTEIIRSYTKN